jgi:hypothetical protein
MGMDVLEGVKQLPKSSKSCVPSARQWKTNEQGLGECALAISDMKSHPLDSEDFHGFVTDSTSVIHFRSGRQIVDNVHCAKSASFLCVV